MKDFVITKNAMQLLSRLVMSCCHPLMNIQSNRQHQNAVIFEARKNEDINSDKFLKSIASNFVLYEKLWKMAEKMFKKKVDQEVIINYFGSKMHIDKVMDEIGDKDILAQEEFMKFIFLHMLIPATVERIRSGRANIVYKRRDVEVRVSDVVILKDDINMIEVGSCVLTHFALVVSLNCDKLLRQHLLSEEVRCKEFMETTKFFSGQTINPGVLTKNTEKLAKCFNL